MIINCAKAGGIILNKTPIDVSKIKVPSYFISAKEDHIAPWTSTYEGMMNLGGKKRFVLSASGHVAGVINPPAANKYHYWVNDKIDDREHAEEWFAQTVQKTGRGGRIGQNGSKKCGKVPARDPEKGKLKVIEPAPGRYVKMKGT